VLALRPYEGPDDAERERVGAKFEALRADLRAGDTEREARDIEAAQRAKQERERRAAEVSASWGGNPPMIGGAPVSRELAGKLGLRQPKQDALHE
jgi:hypothetical protein